MTLVAGGWQPLRIVVPLSSKTLDGARAPGRTWISLASSDMGIGVIPSFQQPQVSCGLRCPCPVPEWVFVGMVIGEKTLLDEYQMVTFRLLNPLFTLMYALDNLQDINQFDECVKRSDIIAGAGEPTGL